ncbi:hypothetical protein CDO52_04350 [Nocardiopsis gilva YIM 90087]|uniref:Uncharacterized protein n=1 Tax=Nocardiopsis gilva YIM 90087 TaxID=1235441 RepID=A0A223S1X0_9ACTN|nr:hypothetical protein [Nocardiopsis gilva]ASU82114.1 hypothetical protein CDO52_04350 [Nocardiopsis gilva YIM 90087]
MCFPKQVPPVRRPELVNPNRMVDLAKAAQGEWAALGELSVFTTHLNDPQAYTPPSYQEMQYSAAWW